MEWTTESLILILAGLLLFLFGFFLGQRNSKKLEPPVSKWEPDTEPMWAQPYPSVPAPPILPPLPPPRFNQENRPDLIMDDLYRR